MRIADSVAVITGGAGGIGRALARWLASAGARVVLGDLHEAALQEAVLEIRAAGGAAAARVADVTRDADMAALMDFAISTYGALNVVVANAGVARDGLVIARNPQTNTVEGVLSTEDFRAVMEVNVVGAFITFREAARRMVDHGWPGVLVGISSINKSGQPGSDHPS